MNCSIKQQQTTSIGYNSIPNTIADAEIAAVPLGSTILSSSTTTMTMDHRSSKSTSMKTTLGMIAVAGIMLLVVAGVMVWMPEGASYTTAAEDLLVGTHRIAPCLPAGGTFSGKSKNTDDGVDGNFETCYQLGKYDVYCWSKSFRDDNTGDYWECYPNIVPQGPNNPNHDAWYPVDPQYVNPVTHPYSCGSPCQDMYHSGEYGDHWGTTSPILAESA